MNDKDQCCNKQEMSPEEERAACAEEILAGKDSSGMDLKKAEQVLGDQNASPEQKDQADAMLAASDSSGLDEKAAEDAVANCESKKQDSNKSNAA